MSSKCLSSATPAGLALFDLTIPEHLTTCRTQPSSPGSLAFCPPSLCSPPAAGPARRRQQRRLHCSIAPASRGHAAHDEPTTVTGTHDIDARVSLGAANHTTNPHYYNAQPLDTSTPRSLQSDDASCAALVVPTCMPGRALN